MSKDSPKNAIIVVVLTALICSSLVSAAVVMLRPIQFNNQLLEQSRNIMQLTGLLVPGEILDDEQTLSLYKSLDTRIVNIDEGRFEEAIDPYTFNQRKAVADPELGTAIPAEMDRASLGRRSRFAPVYMVWKNQEFERVILPVRGAGMWSMLYGYIALKSDLNTIAGMTFYEQNETPGLGDQITHPHWLALWQGKLIYDDRGHPWFSVSQGAVQPGTETAKYQVDALTGATVTGDAVTGLVHYWFGPHGYQAFLDYLREQPPVRAVEGSG